MRWSPSATILPVPEVSWEWLSLLGFSCFSSCSMEIQFLWPGTGLDHRLPPIHGHVPVGLFQQPPFLGPMESKDNSCAAIGEKVVRVQSWGGGFSLIFWASVWETSLGICLPLFLWTYSPRSKASDITLNPVLWALGRIREACVCDLNPGHAWLTGKNGSCSSSLPEGQASWWSVFWRLKRLAFISCGISSNDLLSWYVHSSGIISVYQGAEGFLD